MYISELKTDVEFRSRFVRNIDEEYKAVVYLLY